jgi:hypothetical protein
MENDGAPDEEFDISIEQLSDSWERVLLRHSEGEKAERMHCSVVYRMSVMNIPSCTRSNSIVICSMQPSIISRDFVKSSLAFPSLPIRRQSHRRLQAAPERRLPSLHPVRGIIHYHLKIRLPSCPSCVIRRYPAKPFIYTWNHAKSS